MAPKKAAEAKKAAEPGKEKPKKPEISPEMRELREREKNLEKVPQPDRKELDEQLEVINQAITALQEKGKAINDQIAAKSVGKEEHFKARDEIKTKLDEYSERIDALEKKRKSLQDGISDKQKEDRQKRQDLNDMKKKLGFQSEAEIDAEIKKIETSMQTESHTLKKEKEMIAKIQELRKSKPMVTKYAQMEGTTGGETGEVDSMKNNIDDIKAELTEVREAKKIQSQAYSKLMEARQKVMGDVPKMFEEREAINAKIREKIQERNVLRDDFNAKQRLFSTYLNEARAIRNDKGRLEREQREKEWDERRKSEMPDEGPKALPFAEDLQYLENMTNYLKSHLPKEAVDEKKEEEDAAPANAPAGNLVLLSKDKRNEEFFFAPTKKKQLKKKGPGAKAKPIVHSMETIGFFDKYGVPPPADASAVPEALTAVEAKVKEFQEKQAKEAKKMEAKKAAAADESKAEDAPAAPAEETEAAEA
jgi:uncharacterized coiled-coil DUF342 family protein